MRHLTNIYDPKRPDAKIMTIRQMDESLEEAWADLQEWLHGKLVGDPKATRFFTVEQLKEMGLVGVYDPSANEESEGVP